VPDVQSAKGAHSATVAAWHLVLQRASRSVLERRTSLRQLCLRRRSLEKLDLHRSEFIDQTIGVGAIIVRTAPATLQCALTRAIRDVAGEWDCAIIPLYSIGSTMPKNCALHSPSHRHEPRPEMPDFNQECGFRVRRIKTEDQFSTPLLPAPPRDIIIWLFIRPLLALRYLRQVPAVSSKAG
jgi:hypothetical protein